MRKILIALSLLFLSGNMSAQLSRMEIKSDISLAASNYKAYYGPTKQLTKAPAGYTPFISVIMDVTAADSSLIPRIMTCPTIRCTVQTPWENSLL